MKTNKTQHTKLNAIQLEDRSTPAVASFAAGTLTITPANNDTVTVGLDPAYFSSQGYLQVSDGIGTVFGSNPTQFVRNVVVNGNAATNYSLIISPGLTLSNLTIRGANTDTTVQINGTRVTGNLSFIGTAGGFDNIVLTSGSFVGGNATFNLGGGNNSLDLRGFDVSGNLGVVGGASQDTVLFGLTAPVRVNGSMSLSLSGGKNSVESTGMNDVFVGRNLTFTGGNSIDEFNFSMVPASLTVGGNFTATMFANLDPTRFDSVALGPVRIGGNLTYLGGNGNDSLAMDRSGWIAGNVVANHSGGFNTTNLGTGLGIGGSLSIIGTSGTDALQISNTTIGRNFSYSLGNDNLSGTPFGIIQRLLCTNTFVGGNATIVGGAQFDYVVFQNSSIAGNLTVRTLEGNDLVSFEDFDVSGVSLLELGSGDDNLIIDVNATLPLVSRFAGSFTVNAGIGDDLIDLSGSGGTSINFGGAVRLIGGLGNDSMSAFAGNFFVQPVTSRFEDFEIGGF